MDKDLPPGWAKIVYCRKGGKKAGKWNVHFVTPSGVKICTKKKLKEFLKKHKLSHSLNDFDFRPSVWCGDHKEACDSSLSVSSPTSATPSGMRSTSVDHLPYKHSCLNHFTLLLNANMLNGKMSPLTVINLGPVKSVVITRLSL